MDIQDLTSTNNDPDMVIVTFYLRALLASSPGHIYGVGERIRA